MVCAPDGLYNSVREAYAALSKPRSRLPAGPILPFGGVEWWAGSSEALADLAARRNGVLPSSRERDTVPRVGEFVSPRPRPGLCWKRPRTGPVISSSLSWRFRTPENSFTMPVGALVVLIGTKAGLGIQNPRWNGHPIMVYEQDLAANSLKLVPQRLSPRQT
jgi:hypothetical protein